MFERLEKSILRYFYACTSSLVMLFIRSESPDEKSDFYAYPSIYFEKKLYTRFLRGWELTECWRQKDSVFRM